MVHIVDIGSRAPGVLLLMAYHLYEKLSRVLYYYRVPFFPFVFSTFLPLFLLLLHLLLLVALLLL